MMAKIPKGPDFSLPPKSPPLSVKSSDLEAIMRRRRGQQYTTADFLKALKQDVKIWDNHAAVILAVCKLEAYDKCEATWQGEGASRRRAWFIPLPKDQDDDIIPTR